MKIKKLIIDADICIKIGWIKNISLIEMLIPAITEKAYMHRYVYEDEILTPKNAKMQINNLINVGIIEILDEECLGVLDRKIYEDTKDILKWAMIGTKEKGKNWGEVLSLSMAKVFGIPYFMSDERELQGIIDSYLSTGSNEDIKVIRVKDLIVWIKDNPECGLNRKLAKVLWIGTGKNKKEFDDFIWNTQL
ncbi:hypothetical protein ACJDT4_12000 [Clostridium neuense]|uniref:PIN domain-containing protein n=1 Tax=Clostridium neuense TaxID=1728934 RepID=A0ABW8TF67_9CLOT